MLGHMAVKYYTHFLLRDATYHGSNEFSGVVEVNRPTEQAFDVKEIEALLARNFDLDSRQVKLLNWSRLH